MLQIKVGMYQFYMDSLQVNYFKISGRSVAGELPLDLMFLLLKWLPVDFKIKEIIEFLIIHSILQMQPSAVEPITNILQIVRRWLTHWQDDLGVFFKQISLIICVALHNEVMLAAPGNACSEKRSSISVCFQQSFEALSCNFGMPSVLPRNMNPYLHPHFVTGDTEKPATEMLMGHITLDFVHGLEVNNLLYYIHFWTWYNDFISFLEVVLKDLKQFGSVKSSINYAYHPTIIGSGKLNTFIKQIPVYYEKVVAVTSMLTESWIVSKQNGLEPEPNLLAENSGQRSQSVCTALGLIFTTSVGTRKAKDTDFSETFFGKLLLLGKTEGHILIQCLHISVVENTGVSLMHIGSLCLTANLEEKVVLKEMVMIGTE